MIGAVTKHIESLEALHMNVSRAQQQLCCEDAKALEAGTKLELVLEEVAEDANPAFEAAIRGVIADKRGHIYVGNTVTEDGQVQMGNYVAQVYTGTQSSASHLYLNNIVAGPAKLHMGDK